MRFSRRGYLPLAHEAGGNWPNFLDAHAHPSPRALMRLLREEANKAKAKGVLWQREMDTMRPRSRACGTGWSEAERAQFLRHGRPLLGRPSTWHGAAHCRASRHALMKSG